MSRNRGQSPAATTVSPTRTRNVVLKSRAEPLHRAALSKAISPSAGKTTLRRKSAGAHGPPARRVRDEEGDFDRQAAVTAGPTGVFGLGDRVDAGADRCSEHEPTSDTSTLPSLTICVAQANAPVHGSRSSRW